MTEKGLSIIKKWEGCRCTAYLCPAGHWTIGYGNRYYKDGKMVQMGDKITQEEAEDLLKYMVENKFEPQVKRLLGDELNAILPGVSREALVSLCYNIGVKAFAQSTLLKRIKANKNDLISIKKEFDKWVKSNGQTLPGLVKRRNDEFELYVEGILSQYTKRELIKMYLGI